MNFLINHQFVLACILFLLSVGWRGLDENDKHIIFWSDFFFLLFI
jgi:hypothetical protein